jgi:hypothetical protein
MSASKPHNHNMVKFPRVRSTASIPALLLLLSVSVSVQSRAAKHERNWQNGTLLDAQKSRVYLGTYSSTNTYGNANVYGDSATYNSNSSTSRQARYGLEEVEVVDGGDKIYVISRLLRYRWNKEANVTVNAPVKFAIEGNHIYLLDDDGREHKAKIIKKTLK